MLRHHLPHLAPDRGLLVAKVQRSLDVHGSGTPEHSLGRQGVDVAALARLTLLLGQLAYCTDQAEVLTAVRLDYHVFTLPDAWSDVCRVEIASLALEANLEQLRGGTLLDYAVNDGFGSLRGLVARRLAGFLLLVGYPGLVGVRRLLDFPRVADFLRFAGVLRFACFRGFAGLWRTFNHPPKPPSRGTSHSGCSTSAQSAYLEARRGVVPVPL